MPTSTATLEARLAERTATTLDMLAERLPATEEHGTTSGALWSSVSHLDGILGRNDFHACLFGLDGAHLGDSGLIVRIADADQPSRRRVLVRPPRSWDAQRTHLRRWRARGRVHPPQPISYSAAHRRITAARGRAADQICEDCGERAAEWAYQGFSPDEQIGWAGDPASLRLWSPTPGDYAPLCRNCHWTFDELGVVWGAGPTPRSSRRPTPPSSPLPANAPAWALAMAGQPEDVERLGMLLDLQRVQLAFGDTHGALLTHRERMGRRWPSTTDVDLAAPPLPASAPAWARS